MYFLGTTICSSQCSELVSKHLPKDFSWCSYNLCERFLSFNTPHPPPPPNHYCNSKNLKLPFHTSQVYKKIVAGGGRAGSPLPLADYTIFWSSVNAFNLLGFLSKMIFPWHYTHAIYHWKAGRAPPCLTCRPGAFTHSQKYVCCRGSDSIVMAINIRTKSYFMWNF